MKQIIYLVFFLGVSMNVYSQKNIYDYNFHKEVTGTSKLVIVDFYADWCRPCRQMHPIIKQLANSNYNVKFFKMNVDNNRTDDKYNVKSIPTFFFIKNGKIVYKLVGGANKSTFQQLINKYK